MTTFIISNENANRFEWFINEFDLLCKLVIVQEFDWRTHFIFEDLDEQEVSWVELEIEQHF